jgi:hypothetical protein
VSLVNGITGAKTAADGMPSARAAETWVVSASHVGSSIRGHIEAL